MLERRGPVHVNHSWQKIATTREVETSIFTGKIK